MKKDNRPTIDVKKFKEVAGKLPRLSRYEEDLIVFGKEVADYNKAQFEHFKRHL